MDNIHSSISWCINRDIENACKYDDDDNEFQLTENEWNEVIVDARNIAYYLHMPVTRFSEEVMIIALPNEEITLRKLLTTIYEFYHTIKVTPELIKRRIKTDAFNYLKKASKEIKRGRDVCIIDIMGDMVFYEGVTKFHNILFLNLGSWINLYHSYAKNDIKKNEYICLYVSKNFKIWS